jgi:ABC-type transporter Mla subunit MlaD
VRRLAAITLALAGCSALAVLGSGSRAQGSSTSRFDVIFDDARGIIAGQLVKVAGARAGTIRDVVLTPDFKARIEGTVDSRFFPFHQDATCTIRPEGLIAENYVDCDPGTPNSPPLQASAGHPPTVPVQNTTEPVSLLNLFNMFNLPTRQRFMAIVDELGIGTSSRGRDFNDVLRRANPALALARQVIAILNRQRAQLATIVDATNTIAAEAAGHTTNLQSFLDRAAALSTLTAAHRDNLSVAVSRLPGLLAVAQPALQQLDTVAVNGTPLVQQIHAAVPSLNQVATDFGPFVTAAKPALEKLGAALGQAIPAIRDTTPVVTVIRNYIGKSLPGTALIGRLFRNLQRHGFTENFLSVVYYVGTMLARFDSISHLQPVFVFDPNNGACSSYATTPVPGCSAHYGSAPAYKPSSALARRAAAGPAPAAPTTPAAAPAVPAASGSAAASAPASPPASSALQRAQQLAKQLVGQILNGSGAPAGSAPEQLRTLLQGNPPPSNQALGNLVDYLLK